MKVAMIGHKNVPSRRGGIEKVLTTLCPMLVKRGISVTCYNRSSDKTENEYIGTVKDKNYMGVRLKTAPTLKMRGISAMLASYTAAICAVFCNYDIVHFHAEGPCAAMRIAKLFGKKCVATVHGLDWQREKWGKGFASKYIKLGEKTLVKYADEVIVLTKSAQDYFKETYNRDTVIIPNGAEKPEKKTAGIITEKYGLKKDGYICVVARLTAEKGIHYLIDAYKKTNTDKKLVIAGDTSDTDDYVKKLYALADDNKNIIFTGFISGDTLKEIYSNAYLMCIPSDLEGMALTLLEALSYGNAVLCSDIPENKSCAEDKAVYFKKSDTDDLAAKLQMLCDDENAVNKLKSESAEFILKKYSWEKTADMTCGLYKKLLERSGKHGRKNT